jgi:hypothetical protein
MANCSSDMHTTPNIVTTITVLPVIVRFVNRLTVDIRSHSLFFHYSGAAESNLGPVDRRRGFSTLELDYQEHRWEYCAG